jgi:hypothetical protein
MVPFHAPFIPMAQIRAKADEFREEYWSGKDVPVDILEIAEFDLDMEIRPVSSMREQADVDALLLGDMKTIAVDSGLYMDDRRINRMRYSVAHEIGHKILHADIYRNAGITSVEEWMNWFQSIPDDQYSWIEQHAYEFAGRLLVPPDRLKAEWTGAVEKAKKAGFSTWDSSGDAAREYIANSICRVFGVSSQVVEKRIDREKLWPPT